MNVDCTLGLKKAKASGYSIFAWYLFSAMKASNAIKEFRYRIEGDEVFEYDVVHASPTMLSHPRNYGDGDSIPKIT